MAPGNGFGVAPGNVGGVEGMSALAPRDNNLAAPDLTNGDPTVLRRIVLGTFVMEPEKMSRPFSASIPRWRPERASMRSAMRSFSGAASGTAVFT